MSIGDVFAFFGGLLSLGIALPGLLLVWSLILPSVTERAKLRLQRTPGQCFLLGLAWTLLSAIPIIILLNLRLGASQFLGWLGILIMFTFASLGAAGLAALMGERLRGEGVSAAQPSAFLRGAIALELAGIFPFIGWFIVIPFTTLMSLGATAFALLRWMPRAATRLETPVVPILSEANHAAHAS